MSTTSRVIKVRFVGGAFDGHIQPFGDSGLIQQLSLPVSENMLRLLKGEELERSPPVNSLARYALRNVGDELQYRFVDLVAVQGIDFDAPRAVGPIGNSPAVPGGSITSKPTWWKAFGRSVASAFFVVVVLRRHRPHAGDNPWGS